VAVCVLVLAVPRAQECADAASCRAAALDAAKREDFEAFHDLAWRAVQKGRPNDPGLMALLARAQSLSGRPGDALVMLRRLAQMGVAIDAATNDDFRRVRALAGWPEVEALIKGTPVPVADSPARPAESPAAADPKPAFTPDKPSPKTAAPTKTPADAKATMAARATAAAPIDVTLPEALAAIQPVGLAYDAVSRRFIVGDRRANKLVIFDDVFRRATDMASAESAGFFGIVAVEIDARRGDLWVVNSSAARGASVHKLQLVSGRVLFEMVVPPDLGAAVLADQAILPDGQVLLLDTEGRRLLGVAPATRVFQKIAAIDVEGATSVAATGDRAAYVAHSKGILRIDLSSRRATPVRNGPGGLLRLRGIDNTLIGVEPTAAGHRLIQLHLDSTGSKITSTKVVDDAAKLADPSAIVAFDGSVYYIVSSAAAPIMRQAKVSK
jgi:hypothetical protein